MTVAQVVIRAGKTGWRNVGSAHPHKRGGGWNILLTDEAPDATLVLMDSCWLRLRHAEGAGQVTPERQRRTSVDRDRRATSADEQARGASHERARTW
jgi:hypothetical protein